MDSAGNSLLYNHILTFRNQNLLPSPKTTFIETKHPQLSDNRQINTLFTHQGCLLCEPKLAKNMPLRKSQKYPKARVYEPSKAQGLTGVSMRSYQEDREKIRKRLENGFVTILERKKVKWQ